VDYELQLQDQDWRLRHLYTIRSRSGEPIPFRLNDAQEAFLQRCHQRNVILKARQLGFSTLIGILFLDRLLFNDHQSAGIVDKTLTDAEQKLDRIRLAYETIGDCVDPDLRDELHRRFPLVEKNKTSLRWGNGSSIRVGTSHRGGTLQYLHVSEFGHTAYHFPEKAREIFTGALPAAENGMIVFESTHEGGKTGRHYELLETAQLTPVPRSNAEWQFHFFPWWREPRYQLSQSGMRWKEDTELVEYFTALEQDHDIRLSDAQKGWYALKQRELRRDILKEYPSTPSEVFEAPVEGAIYGKVIADLRAGGRVRDFQADPHYPVWTFWDIGQSDSTAIWAVQLAGPDVLWLDWYECHSEPPSHYAQVMREWATRYPIAGHFLPHDGGYRTAVGWSYRDALAQAGLRNVVVVPRTPDIWQGIHELRELLKRSWFHLRTTKQPVADSSDQASGLAHLESYRKHLEEAGGVLRDKPVHDAHSHSADAARTFAEAYALGMVDRNFPSREKEGRRAILCWGEGGNS